MTLSYSLFKDIVKYIYIACIYMKTLESYTRALIKHVSKRSSVEQVVQCRAVRAEVMNTYMYIFGILFGFLIP